MASPARFMQAKSVYAAPSGKSEPLHLSAAGFVSPPRKRRPAERKLQSPGLSPLPGQKEAKATSKFSPQKCTQWLREAQELHASASLYLATTSTESLLKAANDSLQLITHPVVARTDEKLAALIHNSALHDLTTSTMELFAAKYPPETDPSQQWRSRVLKNRKRKKTACLTIEPLLSTEMREKLQTHLETKIQGDIWENEVRSRLARPLSASSFCSRFEQLAHPLSAPQLSAAIHPSTGQASSPPLKFPYSVDAHAFTNRIRRCRVKCCFRRALKARARYLALAIRVLRRRGIPLLVRGHRRRRQAAVRIQRRYRRYLRWRIEVLRPCACECTASWMQRGLNLVLARFTVARAITALFLSRKARREEAARRAAHLCRWAAKTRVCLFVHQVWTVRWFCRKRSENLAEMQRELAALEASDHDVHLEYIAVFSTAIGKQTLKKEVATWRVGANTKATQQGSAVLQRSVDGGNEEADPAIIRLRQCFQIFDLDGSETLDLEEFQLMLSYFRGKKKPARRGGVGGFSNKKPAQQAPKLTTAQVRNLFADLDTDESGSITCDEFERWWKHEREKVAASSSASTNFLSRGLDDLLLQSQGLLFWLLGRKQQLERKFVKKLAIRRAMESAKQAFLQREVERETAAGIHSGVYRCGGCGRRFGLRRDMTDHVAHDCTSKVMVVDTFVLKRWVHEEEFRLLEDVKES